MINYIPTIDPGTTNDKHNPGPNSPQQSFHIRLPKHLNAVSSGTNRTSSQISSQTPQSLRYGNIGCQVSKVGIQNQIDFFCLKICILCIDIHRAKLSKSAKI